MKQEKAMEESKIPVRLVDCHAHLEELEAPEAAIERAGRSGVVFIVGVGRTRRATAEYCPYPATTVR